VTPAGIEPATFRFVAQHLNHCATVVPGRCCSCCKMLPELKYSDMLGDMLWIWFLSDVMCHWASILGPVRCDMSLSKNYGSCGMWCHVEWVFWVMWDVTPCRWMSVLDLVGCETVSLSEQFAVFYRIMVPSTLDVKHLLPDSWPLKREGIMVLRNTGNPSPCNTASCSLRSLTSATPL